MVPTKDDALHNATLFGAIAIAKTTAINAINGAADNNALNSASSTGKGNVNKAITAYTDSTGTDKF